jgi:hypothetical protein
MQHIMEWREVTEQLSLWRKIYHPISTKFIDTPARSSASVRESEGQEAKIQMRHLPFGKAYRAKDLGVLSR